jgi:hypothetical protein
MPLPWSRSLAPPRGRGHGESSSPGPLGYKGVDTTELIFEELRIDGGQILGGEPGRGFYQMMDGVEVGRVNVAARGCGVPLRALELALAYAQQRRASGKAIADHQAVLFHGHATRGTRQVPGGVRVPPKSNRGRGGGGFAAPLRTVDRMYRPRRRREGARLAS